MSFLKNLFGGGAKNLVDSIGGVLDGVITSDDEKAKAKELIGKLVMDNLARLAEMQGEVIKAELNGNWLQRSWRPLVMLAFAAIVVMGAFVQIPYLESDHQFWTLLELGIGGYVIGRTLEKTAGTLTKNVDLSSLRKKDRKQFFDNND